MARPLLLTLLIVAGAVWTVPALAQLTIVQTWTVDTVPEGICYDSDRDHIWLVNGAGNEVREYDRSGYHVDWYSGEVWDLTEPCGLCFHEGTGNLWIADSSDPEKIVECSTDGVVVSWFSVDLAMDNIAGLAVNSAAGLLYAADDSASEVVTFTLGGVEVGRWSSLPAIDIDSICYLPTEDRLLVGDDDAGLVYKFRSDGGFDEVVDIPASLGFTSVEALTFDPDALTVFFACSDCNTIVEVSGFTSETSISEAPTTWSAIKAMCR
jgi:sugar lactone lactonase YvrE